MHDHGGHRCGLGYFVINMFTPLFVVGVVTMLVLWATAVSLLTAAAVAGALVLTAAVTTVVVRYALDNPALEGHEDFDYLNDDCGDDGGPARQKGPE